MTCVWLNDIFVKSIHKNIFHKCIVFPSSANALIPQFMYLSSLIDMIVVSGLCYYQLINMLAVFPDIHV